MSTIYRKTPSGQDEIETRARRLPPRLRTALILVDGKRTEDELRQMIAQQADETLAALIEQGLIEAAEAPPARPRPATAPGAGATAAVPGVATPTAPVPGPAAARPFEQVRRDSVRHLTDLVGPMAEALAIKMEKTRSFDELKPLLELARQIIANSRGSSAAADFTAKFIIPGG